jgi:hypothetical protein
VPVVPAPVLVVAVVLGPVVVDAPPAPVVPVPVVAVVASDAPVVVGPSLLSSESCMQAAPTNATKIIDEPTLKTFCLTGRGLLGRRSNAPSQQRACRMLRGSFSSAYIEFFGERCARIGSLGSIALSRWIPFIRNFRL